MRTLRAKEGYYMIDHRAGDGIERLGERPEIPAGALFESATTTCSHCHRVVILNPDRSRSRGYCPSCDHYVCDECESVRVSTGKCHSLARKFDELQNLAAKGLMSNG